jgi:hypothetical protein
MRASALACLFLAFPAAAQWSGWDYDRDQPKEQFREAEVKPPAFPEEENLLQFEAGAASPHRFFVDTKALSIGSDGVVRYTLVVKTAGGATNISYEGMRCDLRQLKVYAVGHSKGTWIPARDPQWRQVENQNRSHYHSVLHRDYFCAGKSRNIPVASVQEALRLLRYGPREHYTE